MVIVLLQEYNTLPWSVLKVDINDNGNPSSKLAAEASHVKEAADRLKLLELSLQNAVSMVIIFSLQLD